MDNKFHQQKDYTYKIVPEWNVNFQLPIFNCQCTNIRIVPEWNVNEIHDSDKAKSLL